MDRVPEPELMDDPAQAKAYACADFSEPHDAFVQSFGRLFPDWIPGNVLDIGCGPADITIRFAHAFCDSRLTAVDGAESMLRLGQEAAKAAGLQRRIRFMRVTLPDQTLLPVAAFDTVISNSLLHHISNPEALWQTIKHCGAGDAVVFVMDLLRPSSEAAARSLVQQYAGDEPELLKRDFYRSLLAAYRPQEVESQLYRAGLSHFKIELASDRHMIISGRLVSNE